MRSISVTLSLHYGREDLVWNNAQCTQIKGFICMLPLCRWALCSMLMRVCVCWAKLFCVKFSPGSRGNTSGWLSLSPFTHQPVYWPSGLDGSHWAKAARCILVFYNPESCWSAAWEKIHPLSYVDVIKQQHSTRLSLLYNSVFKSI